MMLPPKHLLDSRELTDHHQRGQYPLSIDETTHLPPKIEGIQARVMLGDGGDNQPLLSHVWGGCLITDILQAAWP